LPKLGSLILKHSLDAPMAGLDTVPRENWPPVPITFWSFRIMVGMGFLMLGLGLLSLWMRWRGTLYESRLLHIFALAMGAGGLHRGARGLDHHRGRPAAVHGLRPAADGRFGLAAGGARGRLVADRLRHRLFRRVRRRRDLHAAADGGAAASRRTGTEQRRPDPRRRHHAAQARQPREPPDDRPIDLPIDLGLHHRLRGVRLCGDGRLRSRLGILFPLFPGRRIATS
jgi:hypothetical protein